MLLQGRKEGRESEVDLNPAVSQEEFSRGNLPHQRSSRQCELILRTASGLSGQGMEMVDGNKKRR